MCRFSRSSCLKLFLWCLLEVSISLARLKKVLELQRIYYFVLLFAVFNLFLNEFHCDMTFWPFLTYISICLSHTKKMIKYISLQPNAGTITTQIMWIYMMQGDGHGKMLQSELVQGSHSHCEHQGFLDLDNPKKWPGHGKVTENFLIFAQIVSG